MFPIMPASVQLLIAEETTRIKRQPNRLDIHRQKLRQDKMNLDIMNAELRSTDMEAAIARRQQLQLARANDATFGNKLRRSIGGALISIGERIRPEFGHGDPTFHA